MTVTTIVCANCGAKYKLPETFKGDKSKCKACGATIDVAAQRAAGPAPRTGAAAPPPAARPASRSPSPAAAAPKPPPAPAPRPAAAPAAKPAARPAAAPPAAPPRSERPAAAARSARTDKAERSSSRRSGASAGKASATGKAAAGRRGRGGDDAESEGRSGRRGGRERPKSNTGLVIGGVVAVLAIVLVVLAYVLFGGDDGKQTPDTNQTAQQATKPDQQKPEAANTANQAAPAPAAAAKDDPAQAAPATGTGAGKPAEGVAGGLGALAGENATPPPSEKAAESGAAEKPREEPTTKPTEKPTEKPAEKPAGEPAKSEPQITRDQLFDPKTVEPLSYPEGTPDSDKQELESLMQEARDGKGSAATNRALTKMAKHGKPAGYLALVPLINELRTLDYTTDLDSMYAFAINKQLEVISTLNTGFKPVMMGEEVELTKANHNAKTVAAWARLWDQVKAGPENLQKILDRKKKSDGGGDLDK